MWLWVGSPSRQREQSQRQEQALQATAVHERWIFFLVCFYYIFNQKSDIGKCMLYKTSTLADGLKEGWESVTLESGRPVSGQKPSILFLICFIRVYLTHVSELLLCPPLEKTVGRRKDTSMAL